MSVVTIIMIYGVLGVETAVESSFVKKAILSYCVGCSLES